MPRKRTESEKFREFLIGKRPEELCELRERLNDIIAIMLPTTDKPPRKKREPKKKGQTLQEQYEVDALPLGVSR